MSTIIILIPLYLTFDGPGPIRAWTPISLVLSTFFAGLFFILGFQNTSKKVLFFFRMPLYLSLALIIIYFCKQYNVVTNYAKSFDERYNLLMTLQSKGNRNTIDLKGLPDSGMLPNGDITDNENDPLNKNYCYVLGLNFKVISSDNYFNVYSGIKKNK